MIDILYMKSKILLIICMSSVSFCIHAQSFNTIKFYKQVPKIKLSVVQQLDTLSQELNITDTLSDIKTRETLHLDYQRNTALPLHKIIINDYYGYRMHPIHGVKKFHAGIDLDSKRDTVYAMFDAVVKKTQYSPTLGNYIELIHSNELSSIYAHLSRIFVASADYIRAGDPIGITGSTGLSTGDHLHLTIKQKDRSVNPEPVLKYLIDSELNYWAMDVVKSSLTKK